MGSSVVPVVPTIINGTNGWQSGTYTLLNTVTIASGTDTIRLTAYSYVPSTSTSSGTITVDFGSQTQKGCNGASISASGSTGVVQLVTNTGASGNASVTLAAFANANNDTIGAMVDFTTIANVTAGAGFTERTEKNNTDIGTLEIETQAGNDTSVDWTNTSGPWAAMGLELTTPATPSWATKSNATYTLTRDVHLSNLTVPLGAVIVTAGWRLFVSDTLTNIGTIRNSGVNASTTTGGAGGASGLLAGGQVGAAGIALGTTTVAGTAGANTDANNHSLGGRGGAGGNSNGGASGTLTTLARVPTFTSVPEALDLKWIPMPATAAPETAITLTPRTAVGGTGGGGGGRTAGTVNTRSGAGGGAGGLVVVSANTLNNLNGTIHANGGNGSAAASGDCSAGGGGGGGGGCVVLIYNDLTAGIETATGGTAGASINGGSAAANGSDGRVIKVANST